MKKPLILLLPALALLQIGCRSHRPVQPEFEQLAIDTLLERRGADCRIEYRFATIRNTSESAALQAIETANIGYFFQVEAFEGNAAQAAELAIREIDTTLLADVQPTQTYEISIESEGHASDTLATYVITRSSYTGGAHGIYGIEYHTYSLKSGLEITTGDLFTESQAERLDEVIRKKICETYHVTTDDELSDLGFFPEYIGATENFLIDDRGITFFYNPYEIGCYALGGIEVTLTREELSAL